LRKGQQSICRLDKFYKSRLRLSREELEFFRCERVKKSEFPAEFQESSISALSVDLMTAPSEVRAGKPYDPQGSRSVDRQTGPIAVPVIGERKKRLQADQGGILAHG
jgi:hypothetical protein